MRTISARSPRVHGSHTGCATTSGATKVTAPTRRSISRAIAGASTSGCVRCRNPSSARGPARSDQNVRDARGPSRAALSGLPRLLRRPDDLPDRDLYALGGRNLAGPVADELAAAAGAHQHASLGP